METSRKRPRPTLSCRECRAKKLKCDRSHPCQQCVRSQRADRCVFETTNLDSTTRSGSEGLHHPSTRTITATASAAPLDANGPTKPSGVIEDLQARVAALEGVLFPKDGAQQGQHHHQHRQQPIGTLSVKGSRCRYYGQDYRCAIFNQVRDMAVTTLQPSADPELWSLAREVQALGKKPSSKIGSEHPSTPFEASPLAQSDMLKRLPAKTLCDKLIEAYFAVWEQHLVILHRPTFLPLYEAAMSKPDQPPNEHIMSQICLAMAIVAPTLPASDDFPQLPVHQWLQTNPSETIEVWLHALPRKSRSDISTLQIRALLALAQQTRGAPIEEQWTSTGALARSAMTMGLHRDPDSFSGISPPQADLRKRLWSSIVEMDLQVSLLYGMPAAVRAEDFDCILGSDRDARRQSALLAGHTDAVRIVLQDTLGRSLRSRLSIANLICQPLTPSSAATVHQLWREVSASARNWPRPEPPDPGQSEWDMGRLFSVVTLTITYNRLKISVNRALYSGKANAECVHAAVTILSSLQYYASKRGLDNSALEHFQDSWHIIFMDDILRSVAVISTFLRSNNADTAESEPHATSPPTEKDALFALLDNVLQTLTEKISQQGGSLKNLVAISIAIHRAKTKCDGANERDTVRRGLMKTFAELRGLLLDAQSRRVADKHDGPYTLDVAETQPQQDVLLDDPATLESMFDFGDDVLQYVGQWPDTAWLLNEPWA
ncbi:uncharacterized protein K452DRAFT_360030 [Aplosporella prunicola CBS 121167]|uniref:Zn(2)-C6 fungal-type domain-containing protein n=1 Tax=Aplosporella prunicola CBS 121167 TaxID=1176127 RepID=A0A6A6B8Y3_9PEZI|nr:uncharacterized protein K452DRAFT_360030 [Aplosporella prunicola CBS 121167]KAF2140416.1 hypothetical protein K452DRAFT_360030 [Aplosporella prunicola CBS 121167]